MRVCVGSPGTFSTRKCRSARLAICGRCVIVTTCAAPASRRSVSATACAVCPPMPASISSKTIVSPPATAAIASATRESSPPEAVSATGANGMPWFGRMRNVAVVAARRARLARRRARPRTRPRRGRARRAPPATASANGPAAFTRALVQRRGGLSPALLGGLGAAPRRVDRVEACVECVQLATRLAARSSSSS